MTQTETGVSGYYLFRNNTPDFVSAMRINAFIEGTNISGATTYAFTDWEVTGGLWYYWLQCIYIDGETEIFGPISCALNSPQDSAPQIPLITSIQNVYPNPFNLDVTVRYGLKTSDRVNITIYNIKGQQVRHLVDEKKNAGTYSLLWNGKDDNNTSLTSGIYFVRMTSGKQTYTKKLIMIK